jgi:hypothetical protein
VLIGKKSFAQIKLSLDTAPRLVLQLAAAKEVINPPPLGGDQQAFYFVVKLACFLTAPSPALPWGRATAKSPFRDLDLAPVFAERKPIPLITA